MKAWQIQQLGNPWEELKVTDVEPLRAAAGMVRVRVEATDLNFADILQCQGRYQVQLELPFTPGMNCAGTIVEAGGDLPYEVGQRVVGPTAEGSGGYGIFVASSGGVDQRYLSPSCSRLLLVVVGVSSSRGHANARLRYRARLRRRR